MNPREAADLLREARLDRRTLDPFTDCYEELDEGWGYDVQALALQDAVAAGDQVVGAKLGLTSEAKQQRMGVDRPIVGFLTRSMLVHRHDVARALDGWAQPRVEPEIAFVTTRAVDRALALEEVEDALGTVTVAAEVIDSRWSGYRFRLPDVVADNTSAAGVLLGERQLPVGSVGDLASLWCAVEVDGELVHSATGAAILGDPLRAVQLLSEHLARRGESLPAGSLVLAGALTDAVPLAAGREYRLSIETLGTISVSPTTSPTTSPTPR